MPFTDLEFVLSSRPWPAVQSLPSWADVAAGALPCDEVRIAGLLELLQSGPVVIAAPPNHGKTFLAYQIGRRIADLHAADGPVLVLFAPAGAQTYDECVASLARHRKLLQDNPQEDNRLRYLYILDDCHLNEEVADAIVRRATPPGLSVLCTIRATTVGGLPSWASELHEEAAERVHFHQYPPAFAEEITRAFLDRTHNAPQPTAAVTAVSAELGPDLSRLVFALRAWSTDTSVRLDAVDESTIIGFTSRELGITSLDRPRAHTLHHLASLGTLELPVPLAALAGDTHQSLSELLRAGVIHETAVVGIRGYEFEDQKTCSWVLKAIDAQFPRATFGTQSDVVLAAIIAHLATRLDVDRKSVV